MSLVHIFLRFLADGGKSSGLEGSFKLLAGRITVLTETLQGLDDALTIVIFFVAKDLSLVKIDIFLVTKAFQSLPRRATHINRVLLGMLDFKAEV